MASDASPEPSQPRAKKAKAAAKPRAKSPARSKAAPKSRSKAAPKSRSKAAPKSRSKAAPKSRASSPAAPSGSRRSGRSRTPTRRFGAEDTGTQTQPRQPAAAAAKRARTPTKSSSRPAAKASRSKSGRVAARKGSEPQVSDSVLARSLVFPADPPAPPSPKRSRKASSKGRGAKGSKSAARGAKKAASASAKRARKALPAASAGAHTSHPTVLPRSALVHAKRMIEAAGASSNFAITKRAFCVVSDMVGQFSTRVILDAAELMGAARKRTLTFESARSAINFQFTGGDRDDFAEALKAASTRLASLRHGGRAMAALKGDYLCVGPARIRKLARCLVPRARVSQGFCFAVAVGASYLASSLLDEAGHVLRALHETKKSTKSKPATCRRITPRHVMVAAAKNPTLGDLSKCAIAAGARGLGHAW